VSKPERTPKPKKNRTDPNQLSIDFNQPAEINEYDDEEDDYEDDEYYIMVMKNNILNLN
jgi:hypothetical protein